MNNIERIASRALISVAMLLAACSGNYNSPAAPNQTDTAAAVIAGNWVISSLVQRDEDKTSQFSGYTLSFAGTDAESGTLTATRDNSTVTGTWRHSAAVTYYGSSSTESIVINLGAGAPFDRITGTWNVTSSTNATLSLASPEIKEDLHLILTKR